MPALVVAVAAVAIAALTYWGLERLGRRALLPLCLRAVALAGLGLLLVNSSCERRPEAVRPIVLLDASLSMAAAGADWTAASRAARALGEVRLVGALDPGDSLPVGGRSRFAPDIVAAAATGRPVWVVSDGEIEDASEVPADLLARVGVRIFSRTAGADLAVTRVAMPERVAVGDTFRLQVEVSEAGIADRREVGLEVRGNGARWLTGTVPLRNGAGRAELETVLRNVTSGSYLVEVALRGAADSEPRTDTRLAVVTVTPTPGIVIVAAPPGWESRYLFRVLQDVAALPVRGYLGLSGSGWRRMGDLAPVSRAEVEQAARRADLLALLGDPPEAIRRAPARGRWEWVATSATTAAVEGDWYVSAGAASPVTGAFVGLPVDSFPPAVALAPLDPGPRAWIGLTARLNRRGAERPAVFGRDSAGRREVIVGVAGLWRWAFRGGPSEQAYRAWAAASTSWLLAGTDSATGSVRPIRAVAPRGRPIVFQRAGPAGSPVAIDLTGPGGRRNDTLRFDGAGRAELYLPPGTYRYQAAGGGSGLLAVEEYSDEWLPRPITLPAREAVASLPPGRTPLRDQPWLFGLIVAALAGEWWWRRRAGLR